MRNESPRDRAHFELAYADSSRPAIWEITRPQDAVLAIESLMVGDLLDIGCGTGENALHFAARGHKVVGVDLIPAAIDRARQKANERQLSVDFQVLDALTISSLEQQFDSLLDSGLFHVFDDVDRSRYVTELAACARPGARLFVVVFSELEPGTHGPRRVTEGELRDAFASGWEIESLTRVRYELRTDHKWTFTLGGAHAWLMQARRQG